MKYWFCYSTYNNNPATGPVEGFIHISDDCPSFSYDDKWMEISKRVYECLSTGGAEVYKVLFFRNISNEHIVVSPKSELLFCGYKSACDDLARLYPGSEVYLRRDYIFSLIEMGLFNKLKDWLCRPVFYCGYDRLGNQRFMKVDYNDR